MPLSLTPCTHKLATLATVCLLLITICQSQHIATAPCNAPHSQQVLLNPLTVFKLSNLLTQVFDTHSIQQVQVSRICDTLLAALLETIDHAWHLTMGGIHDLSDYLDDTGDTVSMAAFFRHLEGVPT